VPAQAAPKLVPLRVGATEMRLRIEGTAGRDLELQVSSDLHEWIGVRSISNPTGSLEITEPIPTDSLGKFYRLRAVPP